MHEVEVNEARDSGFLEIKFNPFARLFSRPEVEASLRHVRQVGKSKAKHDPKAPQVAKVRKKLFLCRPICHSCTHRSDEKAVLTSAHNS